MIRIVVITVVATIVIVVPGVGACDRMSAWTDRTFHGTRLAWWNDLPYVRCREVYYVLVTFDLPNGSPKCLHLAGSSYPHRRRRNHRRCSLQQHATEDYTSSICDMNHYHHLQASEPEIEGCIMGNVQYELGT